MELTQFRKYICPGCKEELYLAETVGYLGSFLHAKSKGGCGYSGKGEEVIIVFDVKGAEKLVEEMSDELGKKRDFFEKNSRNLIKNELEKIISLDDFRKNK